MKEMYENIYKENFSFGKNWSLFLSRIDNNRIELAKKSILSFTGLKTLKGLIFLDLGCGSGLFSLAASMLSAKVVSIDIDDECINCTKHLKQKYNRSDWMILKGSVMDESFLVKLPRADIIYCWGVLHHTGDMWKACDNIAKIIKEDAILYLALYNLYGGLPFTSKQWVKIKRYYAKSGRFIRWSMEKSYISMVIMGLLIKGRSPIKYMRDYDKGKLRGMDFVVDVKDWLGGYPYEYASIKEVEEYFNERGFWLNKIGIATREGCNEYLLKRKLL